MSEYRLCSKCGTKHPSESFRWQNKQRGTRHAECRQCHTTAARERRHRRKHREMEKDFTRIKYESDAQLWALVRGLIAEHGGLIPFVQLWAETQQRAAKRNPVSRTVIHSYLALERLVHAVSSQSVHTKTSSE